MAPAFRPSTLALFAGDLVCFFAALWLALFLRSFSIPSEYLLFLHIQAFVPLFLVWALVFMIAGLYERRQILFAQRALPSRLLYAQTANIIIAALFFFFVPAFGISPKTVLLIYLVVSCALVLLWRAFLYPRLGFQRAEAALIVGDGPEIRELAEALRSALHAPVVIAEIISPQNDGFAGRVRSAIATHTPRVIIVDLDSKAVEDAFPELYNLMARGIRFIDARALYEDMFGRVPLSLVDDKWVARNISPEAHAFYDPLKRLMDIAAALILGLLALILAPFIGLIVRVQDGGPIFYRQIRVGKKGEPFEMVKFRSMTGTDSGAEVLRSKLSVTPFGEFLRKTRIDELPQLWNVLRGDLSLIGPRPEFPALAQEYEREIPYYGVRNLIKPGLSGWAQIYHDNHPHHGAEIEATREKLSYDLYYLKHRSLILDAIIALKTITKLITKSGK